MFRPLPRFFQPIKLPQPKLPGGKLPPGYVRAFGNLPALNDGLWLDTGAGMSSGTWHGLGDMSSAASLGDEVKSAIPLVMIGLGIYLAFKAIWE